MTSSCPHCGASIEYGEVEARLLTGTCAGCGHSVTVVAGVGLEPGSQGPASTPSTDRGEVKPMVGPPCEECGEPLVMRVGSDGVLEGECAECGTTVRFVREGAARGPDEEEDRRPRRGPRDRAFRTERGESRSFGAPRTRPCRQCGAPLQFSNDEDGNLVGECSSCGNRFVLPPRDRGPPRGPGRPYGGRREYRPRNDRYRGSSDRPRGSGGYRPRDRTEDPKRRRRPRRDED